MCERDTHEFLSTSNSLKRTENLDYRKKSFLPIEFVPEVTEEFGVFRHFAVKTNIYLNLSKALRPFSTDIFYVLSYLKFSIDNFSSWC